MWALGCIVLELLDESIPYPNMNTLQVQRRLMDCDKEHPFSPEVNEEWDDEVRDFMRKCWTYERSGRPSASEAHILFASMTPCENSSDEVVIDSRLPTMRDSCVEMGRISMMPEASAHYGFAGQDVNGLSVNKSLSFQF